MYGPDGCRHHCEVGRNVQDRMRKRDILETGCCPRVKRIARPTCDDGQHESIGEDGNAQTDDECSVAL